MTISKCLGYGIILGSLLGEFSSPVSCCQQTPNRLSIWCDLPVKVPQLIKILGARSAEGISLVSTSLELLAVVSTLCYCYSKSFPFRWDTEVEWSLFSGVLHNCTSCCVLLLFISTVHSTKKQSWRELLFEFCSLLFCFWFCIFFLFAHFTYIFSMVEGDSLLLSL